MLLDERPQDVFHCRDADIRKRLKYLPLGDGHVRTLYKQAHAVCLAGASAAKQLDIIEKLLVGVVNRAQKE